MRKNGWVGKGQAGEAISVAGHQAPGAGFAALQSWTRGLPRAELELAEELVELFLGIVGGGGLTAHGAADDGHGRKIIAVVVAILVADPLGLLFAAFAVGGGIEVAAVAA